MHPTTQALLDYLYEVDLNEGALGGYVQAWMAAGAPDRAASRIDQIRQWVMLQRDPVAAHAALKPETLQRLVLKPAPGYVEACRLLAEYRTAYEPPLRAA